MPFQCAGNCGATVYKQGEVCSSCQAKSALGGLKKTDVPPRPVPTQAPVIQNQLKPTVIPPKPAVPTLAAGTLPGGAVLEMKCRRAGQLNWINVAHNSTLHILKDTQVEFKVDSSGGDMALRPLIKLETAQWAGTVTASVGTGRTITFTTNSVSAVTPSTVTVSFGGQTVQANVIVYTLNVVSTPADNFANRSQSDLGVDERVSLSFTTTPVGITSGNAGGLLWQFSGGTAGDRNTVGLLHNATTHIAPAINDGTADYIAPCRTHPTGVTYKRAEKSPFS
jgi:hypothetical protein